jgi:hypothetical protein
MQSFTFQIGRFPPVQAAVHGLEETAGILMAVRCDVKHSRVAGINYYVIYKQTGSIKIKQQSPDVAGVGRNINLAVKRAEIKAVWIVGIYYQGADVTSTRPSYAPLRGISRTFR